MSGLLSCPWCSVSPRPIPGLGMFRVGCINAMCSVNPTTGWCTTEIGAIDLWQHKKPIETTAKTCPRPTWKDVMHGILTCTEIRAAANDALRHGYQYYLFNGKVLQSVSCEETGWREEDVK